MIEALDSVAGGVWDDGGCTPSIIDLLKHILHPTKPSGPRSFHTNKLRDSSLQAPLLSGAVAFGSEGKTV